MRPPSTRAVPIASTHVWRDVSAITTVLICTKCGHQFGPFLTVLDKEIKEAGLSHWNAFHPGKPGLTPEQALSLAPCAGDDDCTRKVHASGLCMTHYQRRRRAAQQDAA